MALARITQRATFPACAAPRRAGIGQHHHVSGKHLAAYAAEMAWREDSRRMVNEALHQAAVSTALGIRSAACGRAAGSDDCLDTIT